MISVIVSLFNESCNPYFYKIISCFKSDTFFDLILVDGGSTDQTLSFLEKEGLSFYQLPDSTRAARLNLGLQKACSEFILLHHPRSLISPLGLKHIKSHYRHYDWAAFTHAFDHPHFFLKFVSWYSNRVRVEKKNITYLDHCIFFNKKHLEHPIPDIEIFEDTELSYQLQAKACAKLLTFTATTSAIRFLERGIFKQFLLNQFIKLLHARGVNAERINRLYEKRLNLNQMND